MLDSLDTLIAFALIFTVVSLLITVIVQMISAALNLRGMNLAWGISEAFDAIAPDLGTKAPKEAENVGQIVWQFIVRQYRKLFPKTTASKKLADHCLNDTLISDSQFLGFKGRASAVRTDELFDLLQRIATGRKPLGTEGDHEIRQHAVALFKALGVPENVFTLVENEVSQLRNLHSDLTTQLDSLPPGPAKEAMQKALDETSRRLTAAAVDAAQSAERWVAQGEARIREVYQQFEHWFETGQERSQEWFTTHARIITWIFGLIFAFVLQLDTIEIFRSLSTNRAMRDKLVAQTSKVLAQADKALGEDSTVLERAFTNWQKTLTGDAAAKIKAAKLAVQKTDTRESFRRRAEQALDGLDGKEKAMTDLDAAITKSAQDTLKQKAADYGLIKADLEATGFDLFPGWRWDPPATGTTAKAPAGTESGTWIDSLRGHGLYAHRWGMLFSALLLSLGAPFWFNLLKGLTNLRSTVAGNISEENKAEERAGTARTPGIPPPTVTAS